MDHLSATLFLGVGATAVMDCWGYIRQPLLGVAPPNYGLVGRWVAHMFRGRIRHDAIGGAAPVRGESLLGWAVHYLTGIAFAALLIGLCGASWLAQPTLGPALGVGLATVAAPFLLMQPAMGAGIAASRTPRPNAARLQSLITHAVFGLGLYLAATVAQLFQLI
ncbi:MAG: DUF2938 domain-containing protein [Halopseudomonas sp.]|uniref:DUF2938 domain-containing protein n=1 Tax=Halopseudomonas sp. TaxID=2901191 RepID=UPI00300231CE